MGEEKLVLEQDQDWDINRPIPREPWRYGKILIKDQELLHQYPILKKYLKKNNGIGAYFDKQVVKQILKDYKIKLSDDDKRLLKISKSLSKNFPATSDLINSLIFDEAKYQEIVRIVHNKLFLSQLGQNREMVGPILEFLKKDLNEKKDKEIRIYDPFGGGGALSYLIANLLTESSSRNFSIFVGDIDKTGFLETRKLLEQRNAYQFLKNIERIEFVETDGITMERIPLNSVDYIFSTLCLHEHSTKRVKQFLLNSFARLKKDGYLVIVDCTSEESILKKAQSRLPWLNRVGPFLALTVHFRKLGNLNNFTRAFRELINGNIYVALSGIRSYESGLKKEDFETLIKEINLTEKAKVWYNFTNPIGSIQIEVKK